MIPRALVMTAAAVLFAGVADAASPVGRWVAVEIGGLPVARGVETTLELDGAGRASGNGGCNRYGGEVRLGDGSIGFGPTAATEMACPRPQMDQENRYFQALERAAGWRIDGDRLMLVDARGGAVVILLRQRRG